MNRNGFIQQTADDYAMDYFTVEIIYNRWNSKGKFYEKLEEELIERQKY